MCRLREVTLNGHNAQQMISSNSFELQQFDNLERAVYEGKIAEDEICNYVNAIVTAENPSQLFTHAKRNLSTWKLLKLTRIMQI